MAGCSWGHADLSGMHWHPWLWCPGPCLSPWPYKQPGSVVMSVSLVTIEGHVDVWGLSRHLVRCLYLSTLLPLGSRQSILHCHPVPWWHLGLSRCRESCLGLWPYSNQGLIGYPWVLLSPRAMWILVVWSVTCAYVDVLGSCCCRWHTDLVGLGCPWGHGNFLAWGAAKSHVWIHGPAADVGCVHLCGPI